jgi:serine/threonine-protein kinase
LSSANSVDEFDLAAVEAPQPERLGAYELLLGIASGGMATVHLARALDRREGAPLVAIKRPHHHLAADKNFLTMLVDEARLASAISHPNVVKVRELGFEGGVPFIVMEYVEGASLAELRRELASSGRALDVRVAVLVVLDVLAGLAAAHELTDDSGRPLHIVHRDVSPHNVLIGSDGRARITDFGIAKAEDRIQTTRTHEVKGKLAYLAPERVDKRRTCTVQSDVFSAGVVFWECFAGRRLFRSEQMVDLLQEVMNGPIPTLREIGAQVPEALDAVIARALSRELSERYASARDFAAAIEGAVGREHLGVPSDVARLVEAVFGARMAARQDRVRAAIGGEDLARLLHQSGLRSRDSSSTDVELSPNLLAELAPAAPSGRYGVGSKMVLAARSGLRTRRGLWKPGVAAGAGLLGGVAITAAVLGHRTAAAPAPPHPVASVASDAPPPVSPSPPARKVVVSLPFAAYRITLDAATQTLDPPSNLVLFEVARGSGTRHHVVAAGPDGAALAEDVLETWSPGDDEGYVVLPPSPGVPARAAPARGRVTMGTVRDGFTKLR